MRAGALAAVLALAALLAPPAHARRPATLHAIHPHVVKRLIPFPRHRVREMRAYARRHYGIDSARLRHPHVIVEHVAVAPTASSVFSTFAADRPDPEIGELPGTCAHFVIDRDGTIHQLVSLRRMCRHAVGLNWTSIGIEHVGYTDGDVLARRRELRASLALTRWLRCRFGIRVRDVIGHSESLSSPYHHERVRRLRRQTHADFSHPHMRRYRRWLRRRPCP